MTTSRPPRRRVITTITIASDDLKGLSTELSILANSAVEWESRKTENGLEILCGTYSVLTDVDMSAPAGDEYRESLRAWHLARRQARQ